MESPRAGFPPGASEQGDAEPSDPAAWSDGAVPAAVIVMPRFAAPRFFVPSNEVSLKTGERRCNRMTAAAVLFFCRGPHTGEPPVIGKAGTPDGTTIPPPSNVEFDPYRGLRLAQPKVPPIAARE